MLHHTKPDAATAMPNAHGAIAGRGDVIRRAISKLHHVRYVLMVLKRNGSAPATYAFSCPDDLASSALGIPLAMITNSASSASQGAAMANSANDQSGLSGPYTPGKQWKETQNRKISKPAKQRQTDAAIA